MPHGIGHTPMCHARDLADEQWKILAPLIPKPRRRRDGRSRRSVMNGIRSRQRLSEIGNQCQYRISLPAHRLPELCTFSGGSNRDNWNTDQRALSTCLDRRVERGKSRRVV